MKMTLSEELKWRLIGFFGTLFIDLLFLTIRIKSKGLEKSDALIASKKNIFALWHSRILPFSHVYKGIGSAILVSASKDGEIIARILEKQGQKTIRGSSRKGGMKALGKLAEAMTADPGRPGTVIPDGPQGPRFEVQKGVILLAQKSGMPITPVTCGIKRSKVFNSWDRFMLPFPFTTCLLIYGDPLYVSADADEAEIESARKKLQDEMRRITEEADEYFGHETPYA